MKIPIEKYASWIILFSALIVYVATQSQSLDDWDSVQFAMGIEHYDIRLHHPHPPGYPLYIFITEDGNEEIFQMHGYPCYKIEQRKSKK